MLKIIIFQVILLTFQVVVYFGCENFQKNPHNVLTKADSWIPFLPWTAYIYVLWFPLIALFPIALYQWERPLYYIYIASMIFEIVISVICYLIYPTTFKRPVPPDTVSGRLMKRVYKGSYKGLNCAPSLHCSSCYLIIFMSVKAAMLPFEIRLIAGVLSFLIVISTMTTKQHAIIDAITALPLAALCIALGTTTCITGLGLV